MNRAVGTVSHGRRESECRLLPAHVFRPVCPVNSPGFPEIASEAPEESATPRRVCSREIDDPGPSEYPTRGASRPTCGARVRSALDPAPSAAFAGFELFRADTGPPGVEAFPDEQKRTGRVLRRGAGFSTASTSPSAVTRLDHVSMAEAVRRSLNPKISATFSWESLCSSCKALIRLPTSRVVIRTPAFIWFLQVLDCKISTRLHVRAEQGQECGHS